MADDNGNSPVLHKQLFHRLCEQHWQESVVSYLADKHSELLRNAGSCLVIAPGRSVNTSLKIFYYDLLFYSIGF